MMRSSNKRVVLFLIVIVVIGLPAMAQERFVDAYAGDIEVMLSDQLADSRGGMVIGLLDEHGSGVFSKGKLDNGKDGLVDGDTIFELGSVTKVFTCLLLKESVRRGEMKLDDPVSKYLPNGVTVPNRDGNEITLLNLAVQDSGLPRFPDNLLDSPVKKLTLQQIKDGSDAYTVEKMYAFLSAYQLPQEPGTAFVYSNVGMALLGHAIERETGGNYESLIVDRVCRPLKMETTLISLTPEQKRRLATGHFADGTPTEHWRFQAFAPAGALLSTANDMLKFLSANLGLTKSNLTPLMQETQVIRHSGEPQFGKTAMPWVDDGVYCPEGSELLGHAGGGYGTVAFIAIDKKKRRGVVVLTNQMKVHAEAIGWTILQALPLSRENITYAAREVVGLGIALRVDEDAGTPRIITVYPNSPAGRSGVSTGLIVRKINGVPTQDKELSECLRMIGGPAGETVDLELFDAQKKDARSLTLTRRKFITARGEPIKHKDTNEQRP
jgi:serine-type D-Ala-D-Ala carboxypeptidase/endopeptidase